MNDIILKTENLTKYYDKHLALDHLNLNLKKGRIYGFLGRNGSGKTTAIKIMLGLLKPTYGSSTVFGCSSMDLTPEIRQKIGYVTEGHRLYRWMKIGQIEKFQQAFYPDQWDSKLFNNMMDYFQLSKKQKIKSLSNGQRAQVSLALTIAPGPELMIMDDPTLGLDAAIRRQFLEGMIRLIQKQGKTILFSSHILSDVERVADRIAVIDKGILRADCTLQQFQEMVKKVRFEFEKAVPETIDIDGLLHFRKNGTLLEAVLIRTEDDTIEKWSHKVKALNWQKQEMTLEDQFIDYTAEGRTNIFSWEKES